MASAERIDYRVKSLQLKIILAFKESASLRMSLRFGNEECRGKLFM